MNLEIAFGIRPVKSGWCLNVLGMAASQSLSKQVFRGRHCRSYQDEIAVQSGGVQGQRGEMKYKKAKSNYNE